MKKDISEKIKVFEKRSLKKLQVMIFWLNFFLVIFFFKKICQEKKKIGEKKTILVKKVFSVSNIFSEKKNSWSENFLTDPVKPGLFYNHLRDSLIN